MKDRNRSQKKNYNEEDIPALLRSAAEKTDIHGINKTKFKIQPSFWFSYEFVSIEKRTDLPGIR